MKRFALVCILGATGVMGCSQSMVGEEIRTTGRIDLAQSGTPRVNVFVPGESSLIKQCLAKGAEQFGALTAHADVFSLDLREMDCGDCNVLFSIVTPDGWAPAEESEDEMAEEKDPPPVLEEMRVGYLFGYLTLHEPSDDLLAKIKSLCAEWGTEKRYVPVCEWKKQDEATWQSALFAAEINKDNPMILSQDLKEVFAKSGSSPRRGRYAAYPAFSSEVSLDIESDFLWARTILFLNSPFSSYRGNATFVPTAVEAVDPSNGTSFGCLPVKE
ncbi:MAG: hypothetical protein WC787_04435 [Patescibacteria group bacterium]|jgi:hypothetical protein